MAATLLRDVWFAVRSLRILSTPAVSRPRLMSTLTAIFGALAAVLALVGI